MDQSQEISKDTSMKLIQAVQDIVIADEPNATASRIFDYGVLALAIMAAEIARHQDDPEQSLDHFCRELKGSALLMMMLKDPKLKALLTNDNNEE